MTMTDAEARARKTELQRARRSASARYGRRSAAERLAQREAFLATLRPPGDSSWQDDAACRFAPPEVFFEPDDAESRRDRRYRLNAAKVICGECPVRSECLADAFARDDRHAVAGGLTPAERLALMRKAAA